MIRLHSFVTAFAVAFILVAPALARANGGGSPPPIRDDQVPVDATCYDRTGAEHVLSDARTVDSQESGRTLKARKGALEQEWAMDRVTSIQISHSDVSADGFAKARAMVDGESVEVELLVRREGAPIFLSGKAVGGAARIELMQCERMEFHAHDFSRQEVLDEERKPVPAE